MSAAAGCDLGGGGTHASTMVESAAGGVDEGGSSLARRSSSGRSIGAELSSARTSLASSMAWSASPAMTCAQIGNVKMNAMPNSVQRGRGPPPSPSSDMTGPLHCCGAVRVRDGRGLPPRVLYMPLGLPPVKKLTSHSLLSLSLSEVRGREWRGRWRRGEGAGLQHPRAKTRRCSVQLTGHSSGSLRHRSISVQCSSYCSMPVDGRNC